MNHSTAESLAPSQFAVSAMPPPRFTFNQRVRCINRAKWGTGVEGFIRGLEYLDHAVAVIEGATEDADDADGQGWIYTVRRDDTDPHFSRVPLVRLDEADLSLVEA